MNLDKVFPLDLSDGETSEFYGKLNKEFVDLVMLFIHEAGFTPIDVTYGDTYFIMQGNPNSVIHFKVKELSKHWKFGLWVHSDDLWDEKDSEYEECRDKSNFKMIQLFCQWDTNIDKFKPSASALCVSAMVKDVKEYLENGGWFDFEYDVKYLLNFIKTHPLLAYSDVEGEWWTMQSTNFHMIKNFIKWESAEKKQELKTQVYLKIFSKYADIKIKKFQESPLVEACYDDSPGPEWVSYPLIDIVVKFKDSVSDEDMNDEIDRILPWKDNNIGMIDQYHSVLGFSFTKGGKFYCS